MMTKHAFTLRLVQRPLFIASLIATTLLLSSGATKAEVLSAGCGSGCSPPWRVVGAGDFNGDGFADVLWFNSDTGALDVWLLDGHSNVIAFPGLSAGCGAGCSPPWQVVGAGDFNGDGFADVLWFNSDTGALDVWLLDGQENVIAFPGLSAGCGAGCSPPWQVVGGGDFNGDGFADVLWFNTDTGALDVWLLDGHSNVIAFPGLSAGCGSGCSPPWQVVGVGDFNGDGFADVLWFNTATGGLDVWLLDGQNNVIAFPGLSAGCGSGCSPPWRVVGVGDFNGDGHADVLWFNTDTGALDVWPLDGQGNLVSTGGGFSIAPRVSVLTPTLSQQFSVVGGRGGNLEWSVDGVVGGDGTRGTITSGGLYTPTGTGGTHTVTVTTAQLQMSSAAVYVTTYAGTFTYHNDNLRTGQNLNETVLTPTNVNPTTFGRLFAYSLDGLSIASPLYVAGVTIPGQGVHNVVYVATEHDSVYAFDADGNSAAPLWQRSFLGPNVTTVPADDTGECCDISPEIGITGTPVIDNSTRTLYVVAKTKEGPNTYVQRLHALDLGTGVEKFGGPVDVQASVPGTGNGSTGGQVAFDPLHQNQRPSLLLNNGVVYIGFGSHGDHQPYHGWLLGYSASTLQQVMALNVSPNADGGGIWQANGGPATDAAGNIYIVTGNGAFDGDSGGQDFGDSFLRIAPNGTVADYFTPWNHGALNANDFDLGAAGPLLLPDQPGPHPHLMVSAGKNGTVYLVDRDAMGHYSATTNDNQIVQSLVELFSFGTPEPGNYSAAVYFNGTVYFGPIADNIQAFPIANGLLSTTALTRSADVFKYPGATMAISAAGSTNGVLWAIQRNSDCGVELSCDTAAPGVLKAYDASNLGTLLYSSDQMGSRDMFDFATKFSVPLVANGKVFVGSMGQLTVYGLLP